MWRKRITFTLLVIGLYAATVSAEPVKIVYRLPVKPVPDVYRVTIAISTADNPEWIARTLISGAVREVTAQNNGLFAEEWDGLDEDGYPVRPGRYTWKGVYMPATRWAIDGKYHTFIAKLAATPGLTWHPSPNEDTTPLVFQGVSTSPINDVYVQSSGKTLVCGEYIENGANPFLLDLTKEGTRQIVWGAPSGGVGGVNAVAGDDTFVYCEVFGSGPTDFISRYDAKTGMILPFGAGKGTYSGGTSLGSVWELPRPDGSPELTPADYSDILSWAARPRKSTAVSLAAHHTMSGKHLLYVPLLNLDKLLVLNGETSEVIADVAGLVNPRGIRLDPNNPESVIYVLCRGVGGKVGGFIVAKVLLKDGLPVVPLKVEVIALEGLDAATLEKTGEKIDPVWSTPQGPWAAFSQSILIWNCRLQPAHGLAIDRDGNLYVANQIASQVWKYSTNGKKVLSIGAPGGQTSGKFNPDAMTTPTGMDIWYDKDGNGHLIVSEHSITHRVSQWSLNGKFERDWIVSLHGQPVAVDEDNPEDIYVAGENSDGTVRFKVNYATGEWKLDAVWPRQPGIPDLDLLWGVPTARLRVINLDGRKFLVASSFTTSRFIYQIDGYRLIPRSAVGSIMLQDLANHLGLNLEGRYPVVTNRISTSVPPKVYRPCLWTWHDANGDGQTQKEEIDFSPPPVFDFKKSSDEVGASFISYWGEYYDDNLNLLLPETPGSHYGILPRAGWDKYGNPIYRWSDFRVFLNDEILGKEGYGDPGFGAIAGSIKYGFYRTEFYGPPSPGGVDHGSDYSFAKLVRFKPDDKGGYRIAWRVGQHARGLMKPGEMYCPSQVSEPINGIVGVHDLNGVFHLFTTDGLYIDTLLNDSFAHAPPRTAYDLGGEMFGGRIFLNKRDGEVYLLQGHKAATIFHIEGLTKDGIISGLKNDTGEFILTSSQIAPVREWAFERKSKIQKLALFTPATGEAPALDGSTKGWEVLQPLQFGFNDEYHVEVRPMYDRTHLYLRYHVRTGGVPQLVQPGNIERCFTHGVKADVVGFYIQGDTSANPDRTDGLEGDARFVLAVTKNTSGNPAPIVLAMYTVYPDGTHPLTYTSPVGRAHFQEVRILTDARAGYTLDADGKGFVIAAAIPISAIPKMSIRKDLITGVNFDAVFSSGTRVWWSNPGVIPGATLMSDEPSEARIYPHIWGLAQFPGLQSLSVREWKVIGPFGNKDLVGMDRPEPVLKTLAKVKYPPEEAVNLNANYKGEITCNWRGEEKNIVWKDYEASTEWIRFDQAFGLNGDDSRGTAYAGTWIYTPRQITVVPRLTGRSICWSERMWVNGRELERRIEPNTDNLQWRLKEGQPVMLRQGWNQILVRIDSFAHNWLFENRGGWSFRLQLEGVEEDMWDIKVSTDAHF